MAGYACSKASTSTCLASSLALRRVGLETQTMVWEPSARLAGSIRSGSGEVHPAAAAAASMSAPPHADHCRRALMRLRGIPAVHPVSAVAHPPVAPLPVGNLTHSERR